MLSQDSLRYASRPCCKVVTFNGLMNCKTGNSSRTSVWGDWKNFPIRSWLEGDVRSYELVGWWFFVSRKPLCGILASRWSFHPCLRLISHSSFWFMDFFWDDAMENLLVTRTIRGCNHCERSFSALKIWKLADLPTNITNGQKKSVIKMGSSDSIQQTHWGWTRQLHLFQQLCLCHGDIHGVNDRYWSIYCSM